MQTANGRPVMLGHVASLSALFADLHFVTRPNNDHSPDDVERDGYFVGGVRFGNLACFHVGKGEFWFLRGRPTTALADVMHASLATEVGSFDLIPWTRDGTCLVIAQSRHTSGGTWCALVPLDTVRGELAAIPRPDGAPPISAGEG